MPLLAFFSRNKKSRNPAQVTPKSSEHASSASHSPISPGADYVAPDTSLPSNPNGKNIYHHPGSNSSKLRLPFTRKESALASVPVVAPDKSTTPARPSFASNSTLASEADRSSESRSRTPRSQLRPPPSKSAIFAAYGDPHSAFSTRSLPARYPTPQTPTEPPLPNSPLPPLPSAKKSFFAWPKTKNKTVPELAKPSPPPSLPALPNLTSSQDRDSFNLKSFRHLSPPSPEDTLPPPVPRPRIDSFASDSSQRISVAAFREAQSRRSLAGSPVPSFRSPSPGPCGSSSHLPRNASPHVPNNDGPRLLRNESPVPSKAAPRQNSIPYPRPPPKHAMGPRRSTALTLSIASSSALTASIAPNSSSDDSRDEDSDEYGSGEVNIAGKMGRQRTITKGRNPTKAKSESGHGFGDRRLADRAQSSIGMHNDMTVVGNVTKANALPPRSQSSLGVYSGPRPRASASASALTSAAAAARKTEVPTAPHATPSAKTSTAGPNPAKHVREAATTQGYPQKRVSSSSSSSSSDSDDDAPLATLVGPKRPGSSLSNVSGSRIQSPSLVSSKSQPNVRKPLIDISTLGPPKVPAASSGGGFTGGATLLAGARVGVQPLKSTSPPVKFVSPPTSDASSVSDQEDTPSKASSLSMLQQKFASSPIISKRGAPSSPTLVEDKASPFPRKNTASPPPSRKSTASPPLVGKSTSSPPALTLRDGVSSLTFSERLAKVVQQNVGKGHDSASTDTGIADKQGEQKTLGVVSDASKLVKGHHRRVSSDQTIGWRDSGEGTDADPAGDESQLVGTGRTDAMKGVESQKTPEGEGKGGTEHIVPTPIRQRDPPSAFSVTSRPPHLLESSSPQSRIRSTTLLSPPTPSSALNGSGNGVGDRMKNLSVKPAGGVPNPRQRSTTMVPHSTSTPGGMHMMPSKPFAERRESPASSTGGSSSGRVPLTPRDGSDVGGTKSDWGSRDSTWGSGVSGLSITNGKGHAKKSSVVSFEEEREVRGRERRFDEKESVGQGENRRKERRRTEAKAAIELGNVINGPGPNLDDEDDEDIEAPTNQIMGGRMGMMSPRMGGPVPMGFNASTAGTPMWNNSWQSQAQPSMMSPAPFMIPPPTDPNFFAAHQQAMMIAKQAYQMAVAQQALAAAGEEWERGSSVGGFGGTMSMYGGSSSSPVPVPGLGMGMGMGGGWSPGSMLLPQSAYGGGARSEYGGGARSEYGGGGGGGGGWGSSKSVYGESFGPSGDRVRPRRGAQQARGDSGYFPGPVPPLPDRMGNGNGNGYGNMHEGRGRARTSSVPNPPISPQRANLGKKALPPSSWKVGGA